MLHDSVCRDGLLAVVVGAANRAMFAAVLMALDHGLGASKLTRLLSWPLTNLHENSKGKLSMRFTTVLLMVCCFAPALRTHGFLAQLDLAGGANVVAVLALEHDAVARDLETDRALDELPHGL
jgi:hypothetical protein